jgi:threonine aldolase
LRALEKKVFVRARSHIILDEAGGEKYLLEQAQANPVAFMTLIGKVLPSEIQAQLTGALSVHVNTGIDRTQVE